MTQPRSARSNPTRCTGIRCTFTRCNCTPRSWDNLIRIFHGGRRRILPGLPILVVLVLAQFVFSGPLTAQQFNTPPAANIAALISSVQALVTAGKLNSAQGVALTSTLQLAARSVEDGNINAAIVLLKGFVVEIKLLVKLRRLKNTDAQPLIDAAEAIEEQLADLPPPCPACVFGPQVYRHLIFLPFTQKATFNADPAADYVIDMDDKGSEGADGSVTLNDQVVLAPRTAADVGPRHVRVGVSLRAQNTLLVRLTGKPGSKLVLQVQGGAKSVGPSGGTVTVPGGGVRLEIPPLALPQDTEINITSTPGAAPPNVLDGVAPLGPAWSLEPHGLVFDQPVTMSINYSGVLSQVSSPDEIGVVHWNDSGTFADPVSAVDDPSAQELTFSLGDFSTVSIVKGALGYITYKMHWSITPFSIHPLVEEARWAAPTRDLNFTIADGGSISVLHRPGLFDCPPDEPFYVFDQTGKTCMPTPGLGVERVLDSHSHVTIVIFDSQTTHPGEASTALMHQLGHALGIAHPWRLPSDQWWVNPGVYPVMSSLWWGGLPTGPKLVRNDLHPLDIAAIQSKYGVGVSLPPLPVPTPLTPAAGAQIPQNDPSTGCSLSNQPERGYGFKIAFSWSNVPGATQYRLVAKHQSSVGALVDVFVSQPQYSYLGCNGFVADGNLTDWSWQVQALFNGTLGALSSPQPFQFLPCLLDDGRPCGTSPPPPPTPGLATLYFSGTLGGAFPDTFTGFFVFDPNTPDATPGPNDGNYQGAVKSISITLGSTTLVSTNPTLSTIDVVNDASNPGLGVNDFYTVDVTGGFSGAVNGLSLDQFSIVLRGGPLWFSSDSLVTDPSLTATGVDFSRANFFFSDGNLYTGTSTVPTATPPGSGPPPAVLFDNGAWSGPQSNTANIAGQQMLFESFTVSQDSVITGIGWTQHDHQLSSYVDTEVLVFAGLPYSDPPVFSANLVASRTPNAAGTIFGSWDGFDYAINGLSINLAPGPYWLGLNSHVASNEFGTSWDETTGGPDTISGSRVVNSNFPAPGQPLPNNLAFTLFGQ
jgi:ZU5 domain